MSDATKKSIARWESRGGKYWMELFRDLRGYTYSETYGGGNLGYMDSPQAAIALVQKQIDEYHQPDTPMKRVR